MAFEGLLFFSDSDHVIGGLLLFFLAVFWNVAILYYSIAPWFIPVFFVCVDVAQSWVFCVVYLFFWPLYRLSFDLQLLISPLVSSIFSDDTGDVWILLVHKSIYCIWNKVLKRLNFKTCFKSKMYSILTRLDILPVIPIFLLLLLQNFCSHIINTDWRFIICLDC